MKWGGYTIFGAVIGAILTYFFGVGGLFGLSLVIPIALIRHARRKEAHEIARTSFSKMIEYDQLIGICETIERELCRLRREAEQKEKVETKKIKDTYSKELQQLGIVLDDELTLGEIDKILRTIEEKKKELEMGRKVYSASHKRALSQI